MSEELKPGHATRAQCEAMARALKEKLGKPPYTSAQIVALLPSEEVSEPARESDNKAAADAVVFLISDYVHNWWTALQPSDDQGGNGGE